MKRRVITIDEEKCNGCGACAKACHEGAIAMVGGKARLMREDFCDGLGDCLPACPAGAITFEEREAPAYDAAAVEAHRKHKAAQAPGGCPGSRMQTMHRAPVSAAPAGAVPSCLTQWPVQIKLAPLHADYFDGASLLVAADCTAYAFGDFHRTFMRGKVTLVGCPKLDGVDYSEKLTEILRRNDIRDVTVVRMEVPCCGGLEHAVRQAASRCGRSVPCRVVTLSIDGQILSEE